MAVVAARSRSCESVQSMMRGFLTVGLLLTVSEITSHGATSADPVLVGTMVAQLVVMTVAVAHLFTPTARGWFTGAGLPP